MRATFRKPYPLREFLVFVAVTSMWFAGAWLSANPDIQAREQPPSPPAITTPQQNTTFDCTQVTEIPQEECEALLELYTHTNGNNWVDKSEWLETATPCSWAGVRCDAGYWDEPSGLVITGGLSGHVTMLFLLGKNLDGTLPATIGDLSQLFYLDIQNNPLLRGGLPPSLGNLQKLEYIVAENSGLDGTIPPELGNATSLNALYLNDNHLSGGIPPELGNLTELSFLWLGNNRLTGTIPESLGNLPSLKELFLGKNALVGEVPSTFVNLTELWDWGLDISYNMLVSSDQGVFFALARLQPDWEDSQTVAPSSLQAVSSQPDKVELTWQPIRYSGDSGYYEIGYSRQAGGPYASGCITTDKTAAGCTVSGLQSGTEYYFAARTFTPAHYVGDQQQNDLLSPYGSEISVVLPTLSSDSDGVDDTIEDGAPNGGDGDSDGIPDREQDNVTSLPHSATGTYVTLVSPAGTFLTDVQAVRNPSPGDTPAGVTFPIGVFAYSVQNVEPGGRVIVTFIAPSETSFDTYYKYGPTLDNPAPHWYEFLFDGTTGAEINGNLIVLHLFDGQRGDHDLAANGTIVDPGAPAVVANRAPVITADFDAVTVKEGQLASNSGTITDQDGDPLTLTASTGTVTVDGDGTWSWTFAATDGPDESQTVTVYATDQDGATSQVAFELVVSNVGPIVDAGPDQSANEGDAVSLAGTFIDTGSGDTHTITWDYGDGIVETSAAAITHSYVDDGQYTASLTVTDDEGDVGSDTAVITVNNVAPVIDAGPDAAIVSGSTVNINAVFSDAGVLDNHTATVDFGTGSGPQQAVLTESGGTGAVTGSSSYFQPGQYTVTVCVTDNGGASGCDKLAIQVSPLTVAIDIMPGGDPNSINLGSAGNLPVAILSAPGFDATTTDPLSVTLANATARLKGNGTPQASPEDVNADGMADLVIHLNTEALQLTAIDVEAVLEGRTFSGVFIRGTDSINIVP